MHERITLFSRKISSDDLVTTVTTSAKVCKETLFSLQSLKTMNQIALSLHPHERGCSERSSILCMFSLLVIASLLMGCKDDVSQKAMESDANGYACVNQHKFYTDRSLFADKCPQCGTIELTEVYGYICETKPTNPSNQPGCGHVTLSPRQGNKSGGVLCEQCKRVLSVVKLPSSKELAAWGATKAGKEQVSLK
jgi:hypothetical protein